VTAQSAAHLTNGFVLGGRYRSLNAAVDASVFGRANSLAIGLSAVLVVLAAGRGSRRAPRLLLATCLLLVMADDATGLHDRLDLSAKKAMLGLAFVCLLALTVFLLLREAVLAGRAPRVLLVVGLSALFRPHPLERAAGRPEVSAMCPTTRHTTCRSPPAAPSF
jgi:hypothetical protein